MIGMQSLKVDQKAPVCPLPRSGQTQRLAEDGTKLLCSPESARKSQQSHPLTPSVSMSKSPGLDDMSNRTSPQCAATQSTRRVRFSSSPSTSTEPSSTTGKKVRHCERLALNRGREVLAMHGITHGQEFQSCHQASHCPAPSGHWNHFVIWVGEHYLKYRNVQENACSSCAACNKLLDMCHVVPDAPANKLQTSQVLEAADVVAISSSDTEAEKPLPKKKRGRPAGGHGGFCLEAWLGDERPGIYTFLPEDRGRMKKMPDEKAISQVPVQCGLCGSIFGAHRKSTNHWILLHEKSDRHRLAMAMKAISSVDPSERSEGRQVVHGCSGVCLNVCDKEGMCGARLSKMAGVYKTWYDAGCISLEGDATRHIVLEWSHTTGLVLRAKSCKGVQAPLLPCGWCGHCQAVVQNRRVHASVSTWAYKIDASWLQTTSILAIFDSARSCDPASSSLSTLSSSVH